MDVLHYGKQDRIPFDGVCALLVARAPTSLLLFCIMDFHGLPGPLGI